VALRRRNGVNDLSERLRQRVGAVPLTPALDLLEPQGDRCPRRGRRRRARNRRVHNRRFCVRGSVPRGRRGKPVRVKCVAMKGKRQRGPVSRVLLEPSLAPDGHFSRAPVTRRLKRPNPRAGAGHPIALLFGLAPGGVYRAGAVTRAAGELLPHRFTLTATPARESRRDGGLLSVALVRGVSPPGRYPAPCPAEPGLSSRHLAVTGDRPALSGARSVYAPRPAQSEFNTRPRRRVRGRADKLGNGARTRTPPRRAD